MKQVAQILQDRILPAMSKGIVHIVPDTSTPLTVCRDSFREFWRGIVPAGFYAWSWIVKNKCLTRINGEIYSFAPGDFYFLPPLTSHADIFDYANSAHEGLWFMQGPKELIYGHNVCDSHGQFTLPHHGRLAASPAIVNVVHGLHQEISGGAAYNQTVVNGLVLQLVGLLLRALEQQEAADAIIPSQSISSRVQAFLRTHYAQDLSLAEIARLTHFSPAHLAVLYKRETGKTIFETLAEIRIEHAACLLRTQRLPVSHVAQIVGYNNVDHFSRIFKRLKGATPAAYSRHA